MLTLDSSLRQCKAELAEKWHAGIKCPCCQQQVKLWPTILNAGIVSPLVTVYANIWHASPAVFVHIDRHMESHRLHTSHTHAKARWWGLLEASGAGLTDGNPHSGCYRLTEKGIAFIRGTERVSERVLLFNNRFFGFDGRTDWSVVDALGKAFNYDEMMAAVYTPQPRLL